MDFRRETAASKRVLVFTIAFGPHRWRFSDCIRSQAAYARRFGFDWAIVRGALDRGSPRAWAWLKVPLLIRALRAGYEAVAYFDADCEIRPHTPSFLSEFSDPTANHGLALAPGHSGRLNSGVVFARPTHEAVALLERILEYAEEIMPPEHRTAFENGHFIHYATGHRTLRLLSHELWNNNSHLDASSYVQHYSGGSPLREWHGKHRTPLAGRLKLHRLEHHLFRLLNRPGPDAAMPGCAWREHLDRLTRTVVRRLPPFHSAPP